VDSDDDFLDQGAQQFPLVARRVVRYLPRLDQVSIEGKGPLRQSAIVIGLKMLGRGERGFFGSTQSSP
jgi:hypothetical protein